ncbi:MAG: helix-turn-helix transcriptional regulator [Anaerolineales bacterium]|nr:helix-turn-helix transcriptional regulator [Anaerolineales bacterium]
MVGKIINRVPELLAKRGETHIELMWGAQLVFETAAAWAEFEGRQAPTRVEANTMAKLCKHFGVQPGSIWEYIPE